MARVLLADDSPHAQRMGERILREGGHDVTAVMDGERALMRLSEVDPDVILVDAFLPYRDGYELCEFVKAHPRFRHVRVVLTAGLLEPLDEQRARQVSCDAILKKPFEASVVIETLRPLLERARRDREAFGMTTPNVKLTPSLEKLLGHQDEDAEPTLDTVIPASPKPVPWMERVTVMPSVSTGATAAAPAMSQPPVAAPPSPDPELVRAAVTLALDAAMPLLIDEITKRVLTALNPKEDRKLNHG